MEPKTYAEIIAENEKLKNEIAEKSSELKNKNIEIKDLKEKIENQKLQINWFNRYVFGQKKETLEKKEENIVGGTQCSILGVPEDIKEEVTEKTEEITVYRKKKNKKNPSGIKKAALKDVEKITEEYKIEEKANCPECGSEIKPIGKEVVRQEVEYIPAKLVLKNYVRYIYKCEKCGTEESKKESPTIIKTKTPNAILTHSFVSPSLATEVIYQKYYMGTPLYRQEKMWDDLGLVLPRNMMANWCIKISQYYLEPLYKLMLDKIKESSRLIHCDETTIQVNKEENKKASSNSYMWVITTGKLEKMQGVIFKYSSSRSSEVVKELLKGYKNILVTDGYAGYNILDEEVTHAECWAHARRKFYDSIPLVNRQMDKTSAGYEVVEIIDEMFKQEDKIEEQISPNLAKDEWIKQKYELRKEKVMPVLEKFYEKVYLLNQKTIVNKKLREAVTYAINQEKELKEFLKDGRIPLTNSKCERAIRPFAVHRKNWLFSDTTAGADANAVYYSFIETAKLNKLNIYKYINYLLETLPQLEGEQKDTDIEKYLPWSEELPDEIRNYEEEYTELNLE